MDKPTHATHPTLPGKDDYIYFWKAQGPYGIFSQWFMAPMEIGDKVYNCSEQYMMSQKAHLFGDQEIEDQIMRTYDPALMLKLGRKVKKFDDDVWNANCRRIVLEASIAKFSQNPGLKKKMLATGKAQLVEASPIDIIWGIGFSPEQAPLKSKSQWRGTNWLGEALMVCAPFRTVQQSLR